MPGDMFSYKAGIILLLSSPCLEENISPGTCTMAHVLCSLHVFRFFLSGMAGIFPLHPLVWAMRTASVIRCLVGPVVMFPLRGTVRAVYG